MTTRYSNRSAQIAYQRCHRAGYLGQFYPDDQNKLRGLAKKGLPFQMVVGIYVHKGIEQLLRDLKDGLINKNSADVAVFAAIVAYGLELQDDDLFNYGCDIQQIRNEQRNLIEALIRGWALVRLPYFASEYEVLEVEQDRHVQLVHNKDIDETVEQEFKVDALLKHKETGLIYILSNKTTGAVDVRKLNDAKTDIQGLSELWATEQALGIKVHGVLMEYLLTGRKEIEDTQFGEKQWVQWSPLVRGWVQAATGDIAWRFSWDKMEGGQGRLGKGWIRTDAVANGGVKNWIDDLASGKFFPNFGKYENPLAQQFVSVEYYRNIDDLNEWLTSIREQERQVGNDLKYMEDATSDNFNTRLSEKFPMYRHSCNYPVRCQFHDICHGSAGLDPLMSGFEYRKPHHQMQLNEVED